MISQISRVLYTIIVSIDPRDCKVEGLTNWDGSPNSLHLATSKDRHQTARFHHSRTSAPYPPTQNLDALQPRGKFTNSEENVPPFRATNVPGVRHSDVPPLPREQQQQPTSVEHSCGDSVYLPSLNHIHDVCAPMWRAQCRQLASRGVAYGPCR